MVLLNFPEFLRYQTKEQLDGHFAVYETSFKTLKVYKIYSTIYYTVATILPWSTFIFVGLSINSRISFYTKKKSIRKTLTRAQYKEILDTTMILGLIGLFFVTYILEFVSAFCQIMNYQFPGLAEIVSRVLIAAYSTLKFFVYLAFSSSFRSNFKKLFK